MYQLIVKGKIRLLEESRLQGDSGSLETVHTVHLNRQTGYSGQIRLLGLV